MSKIVIQYPPDFDGELHIVAEEVYSTLSRDNVIAYKFAFTHATNHKNTTPWSVLVEAARGILAQHERIMENERKAWMAQKGMSNG